MAIEAISNFGMKKDFHKKSMEVPTKWPGETINC